MATLVHRHAPSSARLFAISVELHERGFLPLLDQWPYVFLGSPTILGQKSFGHGQASLIDDLGLLPEDLGELHAT
jgi:hypothetical protein